eukprot:TRINITY_DN5595_c0_g1_i1.p1 TRINITY_DN5595_c0_g1~~TRINITY_DN5595_c0_g1_i1.p1  ORF type:complete len:414 (-),score=74.13 TRINITY_DN5595_c0_g1_i1:162-1403(-)
MRVTLDLRSILAVLALVSIVPLALFGFSHLKKSTLKTSPEKLEYQKESLKRLKAETYRVKEELEAELPELRQTTAELQNAIESLKSKKVDAQTESRRKNIRALHEKIKQLEQKIEADRKSLKVLLSEKEGKRKEYEEVENSKRKLESLKKNILAFQEQEELPKSPNAMSPKSRSQFNHKWPELCLAFHTTGRYRTLAKSILAIVSYLEDLQDKAIPYEIVIVDDGLSDEHLFQSEVLSKFQIERFQRTQTQMGTPYNLNSLFFGLCRANYILSLGEDWTWKFQRSLPGEFNFPLNNGIQLLSQDLRIVALHFSELEFLNPLWDNRTSYPSEKLPYRFPYTLMTSTEGEEGEPRIGYSHEGVLLSRGALIDMGHVPENEGDGEHVMRERAQKLQLVGAFLRDHLGQPIVTLVKS